MKRSNFELILNRIQTLVDQQTSLQGLESNPSRTLIAELPALYRLFHRLTFDTDVESTFRQKAASIAIYISEQNDYCCDLLDGIEGLQDDAWLAYTGLSHLAEAVGYNRLEKHWKSRTSLQTVLSHCALIQTLEQSIPYKRLEKLNAFIRTDRPVPAPTMPEPEPEPAVL